MAIVSNLYDLHGLTVSVVSDDEAVSAAIQRRLRRFPGPAARLDPALEFCCATANDHAKTVTVGGRVVSEQGLGDIALYEDGRDRLTLELGESVALECEAGAGRARVTIRRAGAAVAWQVARPVLSLVLHEVLKRRGRGYPLHAAGLQGTAGTLVLAGASGCGKSTLTAALIGLGLGFLSDDTLLLTEDGVGVLALAFPEDLGLSRRSLELIPGLAAQAHLEERGDWKVALPPESIAETAIVWRSRPTVLVFPAVAGTATSRLEPMDQGAALVALAPNVLPTERDSSQHHLDALALLVRQCDCYRLLTGLDPIGAAKQLARLVA
jgi:hypothetical protein